MTTHPEFSVLASYAGGGTGLDEATVWSVEVHLETCADCRARLAGSTPDSTHALLDRVAAGLDRGIAAGPSPARVRRPWSAVHRRWFAWTLLPWLTMTVATLGCAAAAAAGAGPAAAGVAAGAGGPAARADDYRRLASRG